MSDVTESLNKILEIEGAKCVSMVDSSLGMILWKVGSGVDMELAAAGISEVVKAKLETMKNLGKKSELEDILITLQNQYHIIRPMLSKKGLFLYLVLDKTRSNLALARRKVQNVEVEINV